MKLFNKLISLNSLQLTLIFFLPFILVAYFNKGFIASDEYWTGITRYIPAQNADLYHLVLEDDVKSPLQILPMHTIAQLGLSLGLEHPFDQYSFVITILGILTAFLLMLSFNNFHFEDPLKKLSIILFGIYCGSAIIFTRPMFEVISAPFVTAAALYAFHYDKKLGYKNLILGILAGTLAFLARPQTGIICLIFPILNIYHKQWKHFLITTSLGIFLLLITGLPDLFIRGSWHHSLIYLIQYNIEFGSDYGSEPWYYYFPLLFTITFGPWFLLNYGSYFKTYLREYRSSLLMIAIFIGQHILFANKFERFVFPLIPLLILIFTPLVHYLISNAEKYKWRLRSLMAVNLIVWIPASFSVPQGNLIELVRYLEVHPEIKEYININESITWLPDVFSQRGKVSSTNYEINKFIFEPNKCPYWIISKESYLNELMTKSENQLIIQKTFNSGVLEQLAYKVNPDHNVRRSPLVLLGCRN